MFELGIIDDRSGAFIPLRSLPSTHRDLENASFRLVAGGVEHVGEAWSLGALERLAQQLSYVQRRIEQNQVALLRSGVEDQLEVPYFLFEPSGAAVSISGFQIRDRKVGWWFPTGVSGADAPDADRLYEYVKSHREELLGDGSADNFRDVAVSRVALLQAIEAELLLAKGRLQQR